jgi:hypothetical protein
MKGELTMKRRKKIMELIILIHFIFLFTPQLSFGFLWFEKEKEVKDENLIKMFTPEFPYESIKVVEDSKGRRFIVIRAKENISPRTLNQYDALLLSRGVSIYGTFHYGMFSWNKTVSDYAITISRKVEGEPDTVEISESVVKDPKKNEPIVAASAKGKEIRIAIERDSGKKWKRIKIIPDKEPDAIEPKIGRYPGSKLRYAHNWPANQGSGWLLTYVSKDSLKKIYDFYETKVKQSFIKAYGDPFRKEMFEDPKAHSHNPIKVFGIKTTGRIFWIHGFNHIPGQEWNSIEIRGHQSLDPNLTEFVQIEIRED